MICCKVNIPHIRNELIFSFIYASNCKYERIDLWNDLISLDGNPEIIGKQWALLGDFNQTLNPSKDSSSGTRIPRGMSDFRNCISTNGLFDLSYRGLV
ncbi:hypothetical protein V5N11_030929 [Cardamine amara subsp. amara]|uniref:Uncharacterized protein n=1 Tax=Cardamine amara subsp. amara TaxID=228776 RepID=A0ABD1BLA1_CARAN